MNTLGLYIILHSQIYQCTCVFVVYTEVQISMLMLIMVIKTLKPLTYITDKNLLKKRKKYQASQQQHWASRRAHHPSWFSDISVSCPQILPTVFASLPTILLQGPQGCLLFFPWASVWHTTSTFFAETPGRFTYVQLFSIVSQWKSCWAKTHPQSP